MTGGSLKPDDDQSDDATTVDAAGSNNAASDGTASDADLLRRHIGGDPEAFAEIFHRHRDHLWAIALRTIGDAEEAADALQDALISAMRHAESFRGEAKLSTWLHRIVVNACLDRVRRRAARPTVALPDDEHSAPAGPHDEFEARDTAADVRAALATLSYEQRAAIVLVDIEGYAVDEVAAMLEVPSGTIKSRCSRGRAKLAPLLAHLNGAAAADGGASAAESTAAGSTAGNPRRPRGVERPTTPRREELR